MKREFLQEFRVGDQPLSKEVIDAIMAENGRDIQKVKANFADYEDMKTELDRLRQDQTFEEAAKAWEEKYNRAVEDHKVQITRMTFEKVLGEGIAKARGRKASIEALAKKLGETGIPGANDTVFICHGDCHEDAKLLEDLVKEKYGVKDVLTYYVGAVIGSHSGPGTLALFFLGDKR